MTPLDRQILMLLMQLKPENSAQYSHALYSDDDMMIDPDVDLIKHWMEDVKEYLK